MGTGPGERSHPEKPQLGSVQPITQVVQAGDSLLPPPCWGLGEYTRIQTRMRQGALKRLPSI